MKLTSLILLLIVEMAWGVDQADVGDALKRAIAKSLPEQAIIQVRHIYLPNFVTACAHPQLLNAQLPVGRVSFECEGKGRSGRYQAAGTADVLVEAPIAVASRVIQHGEALGPNNIALEIRSLGPHILSGFFASWESITGRRAKGVVAKGAVIGISQSEVPKLVQQGQMVEMIYDRPNLMISARMKALQSGEENQWIRVENARSHKTLMARVVAPSTVSLR